VNLRRPVANAARRPDGVDELGLDEIGQTMEAVNEEAREPILSGQFRLKV